MYSILIGEIMDSNLITQNPFAVLTFIGAPAILTNASSLLAMGATNRMLRTRERMRELYADSQGAAQPLGPEFLAQVNRVERQAITLLTAMRWIYLALGGFAAASLITLLGAGAGEMGNETFMEVLVGLGLIFGCIGVAGLIGGCVHLFQSTQLSLESIHQEARLIRARQQLPAPPRPGGQQ